MAQKNQYFLKDKKAMIYKEVTQRDPDGFGSINYYVAQSKSPLWCYSTQMSQDQIFVAMAYSVSETRYFVFNNIKYVEVYDLILYRGDWYEVTRVDTPDDYNGETFVYVKQSKLGRTPKDDELRPYGWTLDDEPAKNE